MSPSNIKALFSVEDLTKDEWLSIFSLAQYYSKKTDFSSELNKFSCGMIFFESSSRTRWSFQKAALDLGLRSYSTVVDQTTSLSKGETVKDSLELFFNLGYDLVVGRTPEVEGIKELINKYGVSYVNAGFGSDYHPTQAFLDYFTFRVNAQLNNPKVLIIGDVKHSRVARSHFRFAKIMGYEIAILSPKAFEISDKEASDFGVRKFSNREEALLWAEVVYLLRNQKERHSKEVTHLDSFKPFSCAELREDQFVMHPGPFIRGEDLEDDVIEDKRSLIFAQKQNGVYCRTAILKALLTDKNQNNVVEKKDE